MSEIFTYGTSSHGISQSQLPKPIDLSHHLSQLARHRVASSIKGLYKYMGPGTLNLAGGMPHPTYFPFDTLEASIARPDRFHPKQEGSNQSSLASALSRFAFGSSATQPSQDSAASPPPADRIVIDKYGLPDSQKAEDVVNLATALQYNSTAGYPALVRWVREFNQALHGLIPYDSPEVCITDGSTDGITRTMASLLDPGEHLLVEEHAFGTALSSARAYGVKAAPIKMDQHGLIPEALRQLLDGWNEEKQGKRPHVLYTITIGQNPTGTRLPFKRRKEIYKIAQQYDLIIVEDDPYWFLQFKDQLPKEPQSRSRYPFFRSLAPSYLTLDVDGRVVRLDTFSKTICPGSRCGWITAAPLLIEKFVMHADGNAGAASGFVQSMLVAMLIKWDMDGWAKWLEGLRDEYEKRRDIMIEALHRGFASDDESVVVAERSKDQDYLHLSTTPPLASFDPPAGGMFLWVTIRIETHPAYKPEKKRELMDELWERLAENKCLVAPGWVFATTPEIAENHCEHLRLCFSAIPEDQVKSASELFGQLVRDWFKEAHKQHGASTNDQLEEIIHKNERK